MTIKASSLGNMPIITINDGKTISNVRDIIYDGKINQVMALLIDEKGQHSGAKVLRLQDINSISEDAVIIENEDCFVYSDGLNNDNMSVIVDHNNFMTKNQVITESGTDLGRVTDLIFDFPSGEVLTIEVSKGFKDNMTSGPKNINILDIITIGEDNLIVKDLTQEEFEMRGHNKVKNKAHKLKIESEAAEKQLSKNMSKSNHKVDQEGRKLKEKVSNTHNHPKEEMESSEAKADTNGKIHQSKKDLKKAMKESKDNNKIDHR
jgi:uncharacterized protein YrrD